MPLIIAEKPRAAEIMEVVLGVRVIPAVGHLLKLAPRDRRWTPPYFSLHWVPRKETLERLAQIENAIKEADETVIGVDFDAEGQLIALNILQHVGVSPESVKRMKFSSLEDEELKRAFENPINFNVRLALAASVRHHLDWYFGMNISKVLTRILRRRGARGGRRGVLTPIGRVQSPTLSHLAERERKIGEHISKPAWIVTTMGVDDERHFFEVDKFWCETEEEAESYPKESVGTVVETTTEKIEIEHYPPNKDYVMKEALEMGVSAGVADAILQDLYLDTFISYPRSGSRKYLAHGVDTQKYLQRLVEVMPLAKEALGRQPKEGEETDVHPAIYPIQPYREKDLKGIVWNIIAEAFVKCHLPPETHEYPITRVLVADEVIRVWDGVPPGLGVGERFRLVHQIEKGRTLPPRRYTQADVYDYMVKSSLGACDTRSQILSRLLETYLYETTDGLYVTSKGMKIVKVLQSFSPDLVDADLTRRFEEYVESVKGGTPPELVLEEGRKAVTKIVNVLYEKEDELASILR